jgi:hypothetical protein
MSPAIAQRHGGSASPKWDPHRTATGADMYLAPCMALPSSRTEAGRLVLPGLVVGRILCRDPLARAS